MIGQGGDWVRWEGKGLASVQAGGRKGKVGEGCACVCNKDDGLRCCDEGGDGNGDRS